jgi:hypothetical protein
MRGCASCEGVGRSPLVLLGRGRRPVDSKWNGRGRRRRGARRTPAGAAARRRRPHPRGPGRPPRREGRPRRPRDPTERGPDLRRLARERRRAQPWCGASRSRAGTTGRSRNPRVLRSRLPPPPGSAIPVDPGIRPDRRRAPGPIFQQVPCRRPIRRPEDPAPRSRSRATPDVRRGVVGFRTFFESARRLRLTRRISASSVGSVCSGTWSARGAGLPAP